MTEAWGFEAIFAQGCPSVRLSAPTEEPRAVEAARGPPRTAAGGAGRKPRARAAPAAAPAPCAHPGATRPPSQGWEGRVRSQGSVCYRQAHKPRAGPSSFPPVGLRGPTKRDTAASTTLELQSRNAPLHSLKNLGPFHCHSLP